jgi:hypothetical protein
MGCKLSPNERGDLIEEGALRRCTHLGQKIVLSHFFNSCSERHRTFYRLHVLLMHYSMPSISVQDHFINMLSTS